MVPVAADQKVKKLSEDSKNDAGKTARAARSHASAARSRDINANLKRVYQATMDEAVPDRFHQLLAQLREKEGKSE